MAVEPLVDRVEAAAYRVPTPDEEGDGTLTWSDTTLVVVRAHAAGRVGTGWTYADASCVGLARGVLSRAVVGQPVLDVPRSWERMRAAVRNLGRVGLVSCAMSAVDTALWDLAARVTGLPMARLLGAVRDTVEVYGSGGFTTHSDEQLRDQLADWVNRGMTAVKIKIGESFGTEVRRDLARVRLARQTVGPGTELFVDANGGYRIGQATRVGRALGEWDVTWFEEPVSSDDLAGLGVVRRGVAADVAAGEYGYDLPYFERMCAAGAVDCLQVDVTRCGGFTEWRRVAAVAAAHGVEVSAHCAPGLSVHAAAATHGFRHVEWFVDHERIEGRLFDGFPDPVGGEVRLDTSVHGHGMTFKEQDAERYRVS